MVVIMRAMVHRDIHIYHCELEFIILDEYLQFIEGSIDLTYQNIITKLREQEEYIEYDDNQMAYSYDHLILPDSAKMIFSRFTYNNYFLALWAAYETGLKKIALFLSKANGKKDFETYKTEKKSQGKHIKDFIRETLKYFAEIHNIDALANQPMNQEHLNKLRMLRNSIAHNNGRTEDVVDGKLLAWIKGQQEIFVYGKGWILLNGKFCRDTHKELYCLFKTLCRSAYNATPNKEPLGIGIIHL
jgi:hypothetical protein